MNPCTPSTHPALSSTASFSVCHGQAAAAAMAVAVVLVSCDTPVDARSATADEKSQTVQGSAECSETALATAMAQSRMTPEGITFTSEQHICVGGYAALLATGPGGDGADGLFADRGGQWEMLTIGSSFPPQHCTLHSGEMSEEVCSKLLTGIGFPQDPDR